MTEVVEFGVEQEHFVLHTDRTPPSHAEIDELFVRLGDDGFRPRAFDTHGRVLAVEYMIDGQAVCVTNDSCTHIIEVVFPPLIDQRRFRELYEDVFGLLTSRLKSLGLQIEFGGALNPPPSTICWRPKESDSDGARLHRFLKRTAIDHPLFHRAFPGCFAATHVSLTVPEAIVYSRLPAYYAFEFLVPLYFGNSPTFQGVTGRSVRPLAWSANFAQPYPLLGVPDCIPTTAEEYRQAREASPLRDYSFVAVRSPTRLEFRSACSQNDVDHVLDLIQFRIAVEQTVRRGIKMLDSHPAIRFAQACQAVAIDHDVELAHLASDWKPHDV